MRTMIYTQLKSGIRVLTVLLVLGFHFQSSAQKQELPAEARAIPNFRALWANEPFSKYDPSNEIVEKRDQVSKHFRNADGTVTAHIASGPIHYWEEGQWKTIFNSLNSASEGYENLSNIFKTKYSNSLAQGIKTILPNGLEVVELFSVRSYYMFEGNELNQRTINNTAPVFDKNRLTYPNVLGDGVDIEIIQNNSGRKVNYIIRNNDALEVSQAEANFIIEEKVRLPINYNLQIVNREIHVFDADGNYVFKYLHPTIEEYTADHNENDRAFADTTIIRYELMLSEGDWIIRTIINNEWLASSERTFPILIDPSANYYPNVSNDWTGGIETYTSVSANTYSTSLNAAKLGNEDYVTYFGPDEFLGSYYCSHPWFKFNTSAIDNSSTVSAVSFSGYFYDGTFTGGSCSVAVSFNPLTSEPVAATAANLLTDIRNGTAYTTYSFTSANTGATDAYKTFNFSSAANTDLQNLLSSDWFGFGMSITNSGDKDDYGYVGGHDDGASLLPYITVTYTTISVPTVTTTTAGSIANFTASSGGNVTSDGGASVTARGVLWSTSPGLTMPSASSTSNGASTGLFTSSLTGLSASTVYYYRAYALNSVGYGYGTELSFVTTGPSAEGYYISGNIENNGTIVSTSDENYLRMTGGTSDATKKTISGNGTFTDSKLFADGYIQYTGSHSGKFNETFVNTSKNLVVADNKTFPNGTMSNYGTLTLDGTGIITNTGSVINGGTLTVASTGEITVAGTWTNNGTFTPGSGQVSFDGSSNSIIGGSSAISFYKLKMNKGTSSATTTLAADATVTNTLTLTTGKMDLTSFILTVGNSSATGSISGGSSSSYIVAYDNETTIGKVRRYVSSAASTAYSFPIGDATNYTPLTYTNVSGAAGSGAYLDVYTKATKIPQLHSSITNYTNRYWEVAPTGITSPNYSITYTYVTGDVVGSQASFVPVKYSSGTWYKPTNSVFTDGTAQGTASGPTSNTVTWSDLSTFSQFSVAGSVASPLPIELTNFQANCSENNTVDVTWSTASEHNTNYFRLDKSRDGSNWDVLNTIGAAGNSNYVIDYALTDAFPNPGINYYRLTQYDNDGVFETFDAQAAVCKDQQAGTALSSYPNPSSGDFNVDLQTDELEGEATLQITDAKGAVVHSQDIKIIKGNNNFVIQKFNAEPGMYYITVKAGANTVTTKHSMR